MNNMEDFNVCMTKYKTFHREPKGRNERRDVPYSMVRIEADKLFL